MSKKTLTIIAALVITAVVVAVYFFATNPKKQGADDLSQQEIIEYTTTTLDEAIKSKIEDLKKICGEFLAGDLSGNPDSDCPGFANPINIDLCYYCYAVKDQNSALCEKINIEFGFKIVCQGALGSSIDEILNQ